MHLKTITFRGFKSFADRVNLNLDPGISVIVGPNGSGKSNITDAALWVLGEQSPTSLRGGAMEDVIFSGSKERNPLSVAEVTLCLDNSSGLLPIEYTEVTLQRKLSRSGESSYFINNNPCRLLDILELLSDTGLGRDTYCIISQGRLEETLNSRPEDKRLLIEEAAGVLKHKKRKERAERKLASMESKLQRVKDVKREVSRQIRPIERQAANAGKYLELQKEFKDFKIRYAIINLKKLQQKWDELLSSESKIKAELEEMEDKMNDLDSEAEEIQNNLEKKGNMAAELNRKRFRATGIRDRISSSVLLLEEKGKNLIERLSENRMKIHSLESAVKNAQEELDKLQTEKIQADDELTEKYTQLAELRKTSEIARKERLKVEKEINEVEKDLLGHKNNVDNMEKSMESLRLNIKNRQRENEKLTIQVEKIKSEVTKAKKIISESKNRKESVSEELSEKRAIHDKTKEKLATNQDKLSDLSQKAESLKHEISEKNARVKALEEIGRSHHGVPSGTSFLLESKASGIIGSLDQLISVKEGFEKAIEAILGIDLYCLVSQNRQEIISSLRNLERNEKGGATFIAINEIEIKAMPDDLPDQAVWAPSIVDCPDEIKPVVNHFLGRAIVTQDLALLDGKWGSSNLLTVDKKGAIVHPGGKITYGLFSKGETSTFEQRNEVEQLKDELNKLDEQYERANNSLADSINLNNHLQTEKSNIGEEIHRLETQLEGLNIRLEQFEGRNEETSSELNHLKKQIEENLFGLQREKTQLEHNQTDIRTFRIEIEEINLKIEEMKKNAIVYYQNEKMKSEELSQCQLDIASVSQKNVYLKRQLLNFENELHERTRSLQVTKEVVSSLDSLHLRIDPLYQICTNLFGESEKITEKLLQQTETEDLKTEELRKSFRSIQESVKNQSALIATHREKKYRYEADMAALEVQVKEAVRVIVEDYNMVLEIAVKEFGEGYSEEIIEENLDNLERKIQRIGPVNPIAAEEYEKLKERQSLLEEQIKDIDESKKALRKIIDAIELKIRERFIETFEVVNTNFQQVFNQLFPGGTCELYLSDPDNPEDTGVEIFAQPEGKKLKRMSLLSGGEKSLVAIALLFAIFYTRPSPFYILDEVEPALDDINLTRFIGLLEHLKKNTQFLIITHQRRTMEIADSLFGVSMQADGVTRIISQKLSDLEEAG